jgi:hypothetical protein
MLVHEIGVLWVPTYAKETKMTYATSAAEMHAAKMQTGTKIESVKSKNSAMKGTMVTMVLTTTNLI